MLRLHSYVYHRPANLEEAVALLTEHAGDVLPIAGGTDLVPNMKHRLFTPGHLVALRGLRELKGISDADGLIRLGAAESLASIAADPLIKEVLPSLAEACGDISGPQLRRMGTIGGNVCLDTRCTYYNQTFFWRQALGFCLKKDGDDCHVVKGGTRCVAAHSADAATALMTLDASLELAGPGGRRSLPIEQFFTSDGVWNRRMDAAEILVAIHVPRPAPGSRFSFQKLRIRNSIDFPLVNLAAACRLDADGKVESLRMVASGMGAYPRKIGKIEDAARGNRLEDAVIETIAHETFRQSRPLDNIPVDKDWRRAMVPVLARRALEAMAG
ncbi:MAG: FAD binding domain-containing protein [Gemmatimonadota bacterium]|nr:FAD binding domain-containing protein [Gemmatimonadota bacterium]